MKRSKSRSSGKKKKKSKNKINYKDELEKLQSQIRDELNKKEEAKRFQEEEEERKKMEEETKKREEDEVKRKKMLVQDSIISGLVSKFEKNTQKQNIDIQKGLLKQEMRKKKLEQDKNKSSQFLGSILGSLGTISNKKKKDIEDIGKFCKKDSDCATKKCNIEIFNDDREYVDFKKEYDEEKNKLTTQEDIDKFEKSYKEKLDKEKFKYDSFLEQNKDIISNLFIEQKGDNIVKKYGKCKF